MGSTIGVLFDLDGTLLDSVYQHVLAWHEALQQEGIELSVWRIHRRVGMSGGLFAKALLRETGAELDPPERRVCSGFTWKPTYAGSNRFARCQARSSCSVN